MLKWNRQFNLAGKEYTANDGRYKIIESKTVSGKRIGWNLYDNRRMIIYMKKFATCKAIANLIQYGE